MSAIWTWGLANSLLTPAANSFAGILLPKAKTRSKEVRSFTDDQAASVLCAARDAKRALRWLPWVLCLKGARISEIAQADSADIIKRDGEYALRIHDEGSETAGRSVRNRDRGRTVPIHPALIRERFLNLAGSLHAGSPLWPDIPPNKKFGRRGVTASKRGAWLKNTARITDPPVSSSLSWRHWFIGAFRRLEIHPEVRSALTRHSAKMDESAGYGAGIGSSLMVLAESIARVRAPVAKAAA